VRLNNRSIKKNGEKVVSKHRREKSRHEDVAKKTQALAPKVKDAIQKQHPDLPNHVKAAMMGAQLMLEVQGGVPDVVNCGGKYLTPMPDHFSDGKQGFLHYLWACLISKQDILWVDYAFEDEGDGLTLLSMRRDMSWVCRLFQGQWKVAWHEPEHDPEKCAPLDHMPIPNLTPLDDIGHMHLDIEKE
jgi:hypothetical protein